MSELIKKRKLCMNQPRRASATEEPGAGAQRVFPEKQIAGNLVNPELYAGVLTSLVVAKKKRL